MKKILSLFILAICLSCSDNTPVNNCFNNIEMNAIIDLSLPEFQGLLVPNGESKNTIQGRNIYIFRVGNTGFRAFDRQCPEKTCNTLMDYDGIHIECLCDNKKYNHLANGAPIDGEGCNALMYFVTQLNSSQLRISR